MNDLDRAIELQLTADALARERWRIREETFEALRRHYGLVAGETLLSHKGYVGVFREILNYYVGKKPWVAVSIIHRPKGVTRGGGHFYHGWEKVEKVENT